MDISYIYACVHMKSEIYVRVCFYLPFIIFTFSDMLYIYVCMHVY